MARDHPWPTSMLTMPGGASVSVDGEVLAGGVIVRGEQDAYAAWLRPVGVIS